MSQEGKTNCRYTTDLEKKLLVAVALTGGVLDLAKLKHHPGICYISTYQKFGLEHSHGQVGMQYLQRGTALPGPSFAEKAFRSLDHCYKMSGLPLSPFCTLIQGIARSISRSWTHAYEGRLDEAFLFMIIALEQVFSERSATTQAVASRTAVVTYRALQKQFGEAQKMLLQLYDKRSRLVHGGKPVEYADFECANEVAKCVLETLLRLSCELADDSELDAETTHRDWLKKLDFIKAAIEAGESIEKELLSKCGILDD